MKKLRTRFYENNKNRENVLRLSENNAFCLECVGQQVAMLPEQKNSYTAAFLSAREPGESLGWRGRTAYR